LSKGTTVREPESNFTPAPEGLHQAVCADVWEQWTEESRFTPGQLQDKTRVVWLLDAMDPETKQPFQASQIYTASLHEKAKLRQHLEAWRGRKFTQDELRGFDLENLIGANCQLQIVHNIGTNGKTYANVQAVVPLGKGMTKMRVHEEFVRRKDKRQQSSHQPEQPSDDDVPF
jgi:hypothetical protein